MKQNKLFIARHGDVILKEIKSVPKDAVKQEVNEVVLAYGETTGHSHRIGKGDAALFKFDDKTYLQVQSEISCLVHEEHEKIDLPAGNYEVIIQKNYTPSGWTKVTD